MCRVVVAAAAIPLGLALWGLEASAVELQPGLWELSTTRERGGVVAPRPTNKKCLTPEMAKRFGPDLFAQPGPEQSTCRSSDWQTTATGTQWRVHCMFGNQATESIGHYQADTPQLFKVALISSVTVQGRTARSTLVTEGRRIGECPR